MSNSRFDGVKRLAAEFTIIAGLGIAGFNMGQGMTYERDYSEKGGPTYEEHRNQNGLNTGLFFAGLALAGVGMGRREDAVKKARNQLRY